MSPPAAAAGGVAGERHVAAIAGRRAWLSRQAAIVALLLGTVAICGVVLLRAALRPDAAAPPPDPDLRVQAVVRYQPPPAARPANPPAAPPAPPPGLALPATPPPSTLAQALDLAGPGRQGQGAPRLLAYGSPGGGASTPTAPTSPPSATGAAGALPVAAGSSELAARLQPTRLAGAAAAVLPDQPYLLTTGTVLPCTLQTAMDSTLPGLVACVIPQDVTGKTGLTLLDRGTRVVGEFQGGVRQGQARLFVAWTRAETPQGVVIELASPAADPLGCAGLPGAVDRHFWERFGGALLLSLVEGALQAGNTALARDGSTTIDTGDTQGVIAETLRNTIDIPPTITKNQGELVSIFVARDLDFRQVYDLQPTPARQPAALAQPPSPVQPVGARP